MAKILNVNIGGLNTYASNRLDSNNTLYDCDNITVDQKNIIATRRGFEYFGDTLTGIKKIFAAIRKFFVHANDTLYYEDSGTFTAINFPNTTSLTANNTNEKIQIEDQNNSLFFNGKRTSSETSSPIDKKIKKLSSVSANVVNAGLEAPINVSLIASASGSFAVNETVAVRVFYQYTDENGYTITSAVSDRAVCVNDLGVTAKFALKYQIPVQFFDKPVNIYYAVSNTFTSPVPPDDNLYWGENTLLESGVTINTGLTSVFSLDEIIQRDSISNPVDLYTNSTQEGILQNNDPPICAVDMETYQGFTFYANLIDRLTKRVFALEVPIDSNALTLDGITYTRKASSDYANYQYSGTTTYLALLDLCRCVTATQTKYKMVAEQDTTSTNIETWIQKTGIALFNDPLLLAESQMTYSATDGTRIYILQNTFTTVGNDIIQVYNTVSGVYETSIALPEDRTLATISYHDGKLYIIGGLTNWNQTATANTIIYDIDNATWDTGTVFPYNILGETVSLFMTATVVGNYIYCIGGTNKNAVPTISNRIYRYDIVGDSWTQMTNMTAARYGGAATTDGTYIYYMGGNSNSTTFTATNYRYSIAGDSWATMTAITASRTGGAAVYNNGNIYLLGGAASGTYMIQNMNDNYWSTIATGTNTMYIYNIAGNSWSTSGETLLETLFNHTGQKAGDSMYIFGGFITANNRLVAGNNVISESFATMAEKYQFGGSYARIEERFIGEGTDITYTSSYISDVNFDGSTSALYRYTARNTVLFSKQGQPEAVPFLNSFNAGSASYDILRLAALRSSLLILKTDGIYQLNGISPETFTLQQLDPTFVLIAPQSVAKLNNEIYCLTNKGVVTINESGAEIISYPIKDLLDADIAAVSNLNTDINGTAYEDDYKYVLTINDKTYTYNYITQQWTFWFSGITDINSWITKDSYLYYSNGTRVFKERKTMTSSDFQDHLGNGIDARIEFNNIEPEPGRIVGINALQILQYDISNLTLSLTMINSFNNGELFSFLMDEYIKRVMIPNSCRTAYFFNPKFEWNTEIAASPGTFNNIRLEGFGYEFKSNESNII